MSRSQVGILVVIGVLALAALGTAAWLLLGARPAPEAPADTAVAPQATVTQAAELAPTHSPGALVTLTLPQVPTPAAEDPAACLPQGTAEEAQVKAIAAGAVLQVEIGGKSAEVSLLGVDPAGSGAQAQALLHELAEGQTVRLLADGPGVDAAGRLPRYVMAGQVFVNYELVRRGAALPAQFPPGLSCIETLLSAERLARADGAGYWSQAAPAERTQQPQQTASAAACDCSKTYACSDFATKAQAQACYNACGDYRNTTLDPDHNGFACEGMP